MTMEVPRETGVSVGEICRAVIDGIDGHDLLPEIQKLSQRYPGERWIRELIENTRRERVQYGWKKPDPSKTEAIRLEGPTCFKCRKPIGIGLLCDDCRGHSVWAGADQIAKNAPKKKK